MKTDPISAAAAYRIYFQRITHAQTLHEARKHAAQALDITFNPPQRGMLSISSGYGRNTSEAFVTIALANPEEVANPHVQLGSHQARQVAMQILEAADAAESDGFVMDWLRSEAELNDGQAAGVLAQFREWRDQQRKKQNEE